MWPINDCCHLKENGLQCQYEGIKAQTSFVPFVRSMKTDSVCALWLFIVKWVQLFAIEIWMCNISVVGKFYLVVPIKKKKNCYLVAFSDFKTCQKCQEFLLKSFNFQKNWNLNLFSTKSCSCQRQMYMNKDPVSQELWVSSLPFYIRSDLESLRLEDYFCNAITRWKNVFLDVSKLFFFYI